MVDLIILSNGKTLAFRKMTQSTINSVKDARCNILVIDQTGAKYNNCNTIQIKEKFNYNKFANIGAKMNTNEWIIIANNDLIFTAGWLDELLKADYPIVSPKEPKDKRQIDLISGNHKGYETGRHLSGWCFMIKRELWEKIGGFDEDMEFWCADNSLVEQLKALNVAPMLVTSSIVKHLGSQTLNQSHNIDELTKQQVIKFNKKYNKNLFNYGQG